MAIERVFVAGAGLMGHGIAQVHAVSGRTVVLYEPDLARALAGRERIAGNLARSVDKGRLEPADRDAALARLEPSDDVRRAAEADIAIEAVFEDIDVKRRLWTALDEVASATAIFATNTSSISIDALAASLRAERRPRFAGMHFFSPVPVMPLVELIRGMATSDATAGEIRDLATALGKQVVVSADRPGFLVNRVLMPMLAEAMRAFEEGTGTAQDIDTGRAAGPEPSDGTAAPGRLHRSRRVPGHPARDARGPRRRAVPAAKGARGSRRGGASR